MTDQEEIKSEEEDSMTAERYSWDRHSTFLLIKEYKKYRSEFNNPDVRKRMIWERICNHLSSLGYCFDVEQCEKKWRNLKKTFKDNEGKQVVTWVYYDVLKNIFSPESDAKKRKISEEENFLDVDFEEEDSLESSLGDEDESPPIWFINFLDQYRQDEKKKLKMLEDMHNDIVELEKQKCSLLKTLIDKLS